jgi:hypothetical protein
LGNIFLLIRVETNRSNLINRVEKEFHLSTVEMVIDYKPNIFTGREIYEKAVWGIDFYWFLLNFNWVGNIHNSTENV